MNPPVTIRTLTDGGQTADGRSRPRSPPSSTARGGRSTSPSTTSTSGRETAAIVGDAIRRAHGRGVRVRLVYNVDHRNPIPVPPPRVAGRGADPRRCRVEATPIAGVPDLMHHKYVVRDGDVGLDRLDQLDGRLVVAAGERDRDRRVARGRRRLPARLRAAPRPPTRSPRPGGRARAGTTASGRGSRPGTARTSRTGSRRRSRRPRGAFASARR